ncbi:hypothetical protein NP233_g3387 [Leucocoprinus birnbaumii]|uniref:Protein kinase domain-containing protein n=1 Tax=Leucocoprinus birnbaumii TaxID=56174 RepID=A0AAD5YYD0_9AGAR|nr:hypothetical protein NP233_g3387 [Leucocoprinus birnbaumii]
MLRIPSPENLQLHPDLSGKVEREIGNFPGPVHIGGFSDIYIGHLVGEPLSKVLHPFLDHKLDLLINQRSIKVAIKVLRIADELADLQKISQGTLRDYVKKSPDRPIINEPTRVLLILGIARGLEYLHQHDVIHGDLKPSNILMSDENRPLLCDFGCSSIINMRGFTTKLAGTVRYRAPELLEETVTSPNASTDVCAFGLTAFEIVNNGAEPPLPDPAPASKEYLWPILLPCFNRDPEARPSIQSLVQELEACVAEVISNSSHRGEWSPGVFEATQS